MLFNKILFQIPLFKGKFTILFIFLICLIRLPLLASNGQDTLNNNIGGLRFYSQEVHANERTSLSLFPNYYVINSSFSLSFDCDIYNVKYFGYIFRLICVENGKEKPVFHLIQNPGMQQDSYKLELYSSESKSNIDFQLPAEKQNRLHIIINYLDDKHELKIGCNGNEKSIKGVNLKNIKSKIIFGLYGHENEDVASMGIRNIRLLKDNKTIYFWPLNEFKGQIASDKIKGIKSHVKNPIWLRNDHFYWEKLRSFECDAMAGVIFKQKNQQFYLINKDSLVVFTPSTDDFDVLKYRTVRPFPKHQHFSIYNKSKNQIISYDFKFLKSPPGKRVYSVLNEETMKWSEVDETTGHLNNHQHNSFWSTDSTFTLFAGYSDFSYFNDFKTFDFSTNTWQIVKMTGDTIFPRTETAIVKDEEANILYIFSGFGNEHGKQVYGARVYNDFFAVDLINNHVKKLFDLKNYNLDLLPKGGLIFNNEKSNLYTMLGETSDESFLRLYQINISDNIITPVSDTIPFYFGRMESNVYLFKDDLAQSLYCICRECKNSDKSLISIYRIKFPPSDLFDPENASLPFNSNIIILISFALFGGLLTVYLIIKKRNKIKNEDDKKSKAEFNTQSDFVSEIASRKNKNAIWFLREFKLFNNKGRDITHLLPKKLKELFLLVFFETLNSDGIDSNKLSDTLWPGMEKNHQKNNRGVIANGVRKVLEECNGIKLIYTDKHWRFEFDESCYIDILEVKKRIENKEYLAKPEIFVSLVSYGNILQSLHFEWLDKIKANYESEILTCIYELCDSYLSKEDYLACLDASIIILEKFDSLDETALCFKIISLYKLKGYSKAQIEFEFFRKRYFTTFREEYKRTFEEILQYRK